MMRLSVKLFILAALGTTLFYNCSEEPIVELPPGSANTEFSPFLSFVTGQGLESTDVQLAPGDTIQVQFIGQSNDKAEQNGDLKTFSFLVNEGPVPDLAAKVMLNNNPMTQSTIDIPAEEKDSINWTMDIILPDSSGVFLYSFIVEAANDELAKLELEITTIILPNIVINDADHYELIPESILSLPLEVNAGDRLLLKFGIVEDDLFIDPSRLNIDGLTISENPFELTMGEMGGFNPTLDITIQKEEKISNYIIAVSDTLDHTYFSSFSVDSRIITPIDPLKITLYEYLLDSLISTDDERLQALDLNRRINTTANDASAEIRDDGVDNFNNWKKRFRAINNATAKLLTPATVGPSFFEDIIFEAELARAWPDGLKFESFTNDSIITAMDTSIIAVPVSEPLNLKDLFVVFKDDKYHLLRVDSIITNDPNRNRIVFEIKN